MTDEARGGFLHRWSRRKSEAREGQRQDDALDPALRQDQRQDGATHPSTQSDGTHVSDPSPVPDGIVQAPPGLDAPADARVARAESQAEAAEPAPLTLDDVKALSSESDFSAFVSPQVDPSVRNAALKKLFSDPHYNVMDGLDIYIDDYSQLEPLPAPMLRRMASAHALKMFETLTDDSGAAAADQTDSQSLGQAQAPPQIDEASAAEHALSEPPAPAESECSDVGPGRTTP